MTALRTNTESHPVFPHATITVEDRRAVALALITTERSLKWNPQASFSAAAEDALRSHMGVHPQAFLTLSQVRLIREMSAPYVNRRLVSIARAGKHLSVVSTATAIAH